MTAASEPAEEGAAGEADPYVVQLSRQARRKPERGSSRRCGSRGDRGHPAFDRGQPFPGGQAAQRAVRRVLLGSSRHLSNHLPHRRGQARRGNPLDPSPARRLPLVANCGLSLLGDGLIGHGVYPYRGVCGGDVAGDDPDQRPERLRSSAARRMAAKSGFMLTARKGVPPRRQGLRRAG